MNALFRVKYLEKISDPEYYNKEIKRLKSNVRKGYNRRKLGVHYVEELKQLFKQLLAAKKSAQEAFLKPVLGREGKGEKEIGKIFLPSNFVMDGSSQTRQKRSIL